MKQVNKILSVLLLIGTIFCNYLTVNAQTTVDNLLECRYINSD